MKQYFPKIAGLISVCLLLSACLGPETPQQVSEAFWEAVEDNRVDDIVRHSTLKEVSGYQAFPLDWERRKISQGKVIIDKEQASIETIISTTGEPGENVFSFNTYLVYKNKTWLVDYDATANALAIHTSINSFLGNVNRLGDEISKQLQQASTVLSSELEQLAGEMDELSRSIVADARQGLQEYSDALRHDMEELADAIRRSLKDRKQQASPEDRKKIQEVATRLDQSREQLEPELSSIVQSSQEISRSQQQLASLDDEIFGNDKRAWQAWMEKMAEDMKSLLRDLHKKDH